MNNFDSTYGGLCLLIVSNLHGVTNEFLKYPFSSFMFHNFKLLSKVLLQRF